MNHRFHWFPFFTSHYPNLIQTRAIMTKQPISVFVVYKDVELCLLVDRLHIAASCIHTQASVCFDPSFFFQIFSSAVCRGSEKTQYQEEHNQFECAKNKNQVQGGIRVIKGLEGVLADTASLAMATRGTALVAGRLTR